MSKPSDQDYGTFTFSITDENNSDDKQLNKLIFTTNPKDTFYFKNKRGVASAQQPPNPKYYIPFNINIFKTTFQKKSSSSTSINEFFIPDLNTFITNTMKESLTPQTYIKFITTKSLVEQFINEYKTKYPDKKIIQDLTERDSTIEHIKTINDKSKEETTSLIESIKRKYAYKIFIENIYLFLIKVLLTKHGTFIYLDTNKEKVAQDKAKAAAAAAAPAAAPAAAVAQEEEQELDEYEEEELYSKKEKPGLHFISYSGVKEEDFKSLKTKINKFIKDYQNNEPETLMIDPNIQLKLKKNELSDEDLKKITKQILYDGFLSSKKNKNEDLVGLSLSETIYHEIVTKEVYENILSHEFFKLPKYDKDKLNEKFRKMKEQQVEDSENKALAAEENKHAAALVVKRLEEEGLEPNDMKITIAKKKLEQAEDILKAAKAKVASDKGSYGHSMGGEYFIAKIRKGIDEFKKINSILREILISDESIDEDIIKMLKFYFSKKEKETKRKKEIVIFITITPENLKALDKLAILYSSAPSLEDIKNFQKKLQQQISNYVSKCQPTEELENKITEQCETICNKENPGMKEKLWCKICESYIRCVYDQNYTPQSELDAAIKEAAKTSEKKTADAAADAAKAVYINKITNPEQLPKEVKSIIKLTLPRQLEALRNKTQEELKKLEQAQAPIEGVPVEGVPVGPIVRGIRVGGRKTISKNKLKQNLNHSIKNRIRTN